MPRTRCTSCGTKFSADTEKCPHCGRPLPSAVSSGMILMLIAGGIVVIFVLIPILQ